MARFKSLLQETWWLWIAMAVFGSLMSFLHSVFLLTFPVCIFVFLWFSFIRYDEEGQFRGT